MAEYKSQWKDKIDELAAQIQNRGPFQFDFDADAMAKNYRDQAIIGGQRAMADTMAKASAMTGGQLSSYSQAVGQQQYNRYLQDLLGKYMGLAQLAMERYDREGAEMKDQLGYLQGQEAKDYDRWKDDQEWQHMLDREAIEDQRYADALAARGSGGGGGGGGGRGRGGGGGGSLDGYTGWVTDPDMLAELDAMEIPVDGVEYVGDLVYEHGGSPFHNGYGPKPGNGNSYISNSSYNSINSKLQNASNILAGYKNKGKKKKMDDPYGWYY